VNAELEFATEATWPMLIGLCHWVASQDQSKSWAWLPMGMVGEVASGEAEHCNRRRLPWVPAATLLAAAGLTSRPPGRQQPTAEQDQAARISRAARA
jgi:hypothetical protein